MPDKDFYQSLEAEGAEAYEAVSEDGQRVGGATLQRLLKRSEGSTVYGIDISEESVAKAKKVNADSPYEAIECDYHRREGIVCLRLDFVEFHRDSAV